jgi:hypothetical protein
MHKLSQKSRERWPSFAVDAPRSPNAKAKAKAS